MSATHSQHVPGDTHGLRCRPEPDDAVPVLPDFWLLREDIATLRRHLPVLRPTAELARVAEDLVRTQEEISRTGWADLDRLQRLRHDLLTSHPALAALHSALVVAARIQRIVP